MGPAGSENWHAMLDGAEDILRDEGHAELTSRRVAERIGVKQRLIYYYFSTMDELIVQMFRRLSERELARLEQATNSDQPLREIWGVCIHTTDARLVSEFMALAHRIEGLKKEVTFFIEESRAIQVRAIKKAETLAGVSSPIAPDALAMIATSLALSMVREDQLGVESGHKASQALIDQILDKLEPRKGM